MNKQLKNLCLGNLRHAAQTTAKGPCYCDPLYPRLPLYERMQMHAISHYPNPVALQLMDRPSLSALPPPTPALPSASEAKAPSPRTRLGVVSFLFFAPRAVHRHVLFAQISLLLSPSIMYPRTSTHAHAFPPPFTWLM